MNYSTEQVVRGLISYADNEIIIKLPTSGKWLLGTVMGVATNKTANIIEDLKRNPVISMLGLVDSENNIDIDALISALKSSADKYGKLTVDVPMLGTMTFNTNDIERLRTYIQ